MLKLSLSYGLAIVLRVLTLAMAALGIVIQRKSHLKNDSLPPPMRKNALTRPLWHLGFWLYMISSIISDLIGISSLPLLVISLVGTLLLFFNAIYSHFILNENMTIGGCVATALVALASTGLAILLNLPNAPRSTEELEQLIKTPVYIVYSVLTCVVLVVLWITTRVVLRKKNVLGNALDRNDDDGEKRMDRLNFWVALLYQASSTILAALAIVFAKITFDLLQQNITTGHNQFNSAISIVFLVITVVATILQLIFFNYSLHYYPTLFTIPFGYSLGIVLACLNTLVYYDSFFVLEPWKSVLVILCVLVTILGVYILSR